MNGKEAFNIIRPYIDPMEHSEFNTAEMSEAFCMMYVCAKEYDETHSEKQLHKKNKGMTC